MKDLTQLAEDLAYYIVELDSEKVADPEILAKLINKKLKELLK